MKPLFIPERTYGVLVQNVARSPLELSEEEVVYRGYSVLNSGYTPVQLQDISEKFDHAYCSYISKYGEDRLKNINENYTMRALLTEGEEIFLQLSLNETLLALLKKLIPGKFILNQQNGVVNPPQKTYNQAAWHRDLPYQHFVSSRPIAVNALFCIDDFTRDNGGSFVLPGSHKFEAFPSAGYVQNNAIQLEAKAGSFIILDSMLFHSGGFNGTNSARRGVNHLYNIPFLKQQIQLPRNMQHQLSEEACEIMGFDYSEASSVESWLNKRKIKNDC